MNLHFRCLSIIFYPRPLVQVEHWSPDWLMPLTQWSLNKKKKKEPAWFGEGGTMFSSCRKVLCIKHQQDSAGKTMGKRTLSTCKVIRWLTLTRDQSIRRLQYQLTQLEIGQSFLLVWEATHDACLSYDNWQWIYLFFLWTTIQVFVGVFFFPILVDLLQCNLSTRTSLRALRQK